MMMVRSFLVGLTVMAGVATAQDAAAEALRDMQIGMQGLKQAGSDPALLAQLMQDLQNPELMAEAKKMMENPEWVKQMKQLQNSREFKESVKAASEVMADPNAAAHAEAKYEHMAEVGQQQLKNGAASAMEQAMAAMSDPAVMQEMTKMIKDPNFTKQLEAMAKDPQFKNYVDAMKDMMQDPAKKAQFEAAQAKLLSQTR